MAPACFTADATLKSPVIDITGHDEIRAFAGRFAAQRAAGTQFRHMVSNIAVTLDGGKLATVTADLPVPTPKGTPAPNKKGTPTSGPSPAQPPAPMPVDAVVSEKFDYRSQAQPVAAP